MNELIEACKENDTELAREALNEEADPNYDNGYGNTPLIFACMHEDSFPLIKLLVEKGALVNHKNKHGETPIMTAYTHECEKKTLAYLIEKTSVEFLMERDHGLQCLIDVMVERRDFEAAQLFLKKHIPRNLNVKQLDWLEDMCYAAGDTEMLEKIEECMSGLTASGSSDSHESYSSDEEEYASSPRSPRFKY